MNDLRARTGRTQANRISRKVVGKCIMWDNKPIYGPDVGAEKTPEAIRRSYEQMKEYLRESLWTSF